MFTSDIKRSRLAYLGFAVFCAVFAAIYEYFSHNVYTAYMTMAWIIPLVGGVLAEIFMRIDRSLCRQARNMYRGADRPDDGYRRQSAGSPDGGRNKNSAESPDGGQHSGTHSGTHRLLSPRCNLAVQFLAGAIIWLTIGSIYEGVLVIYGTTNHLIYVFLIAGCAQAVAAFALMIMAIVQLK